MPTPSRTRRRTGPGRAHARNSKRPTDGQVAGHAAALALHQAGRLAEAAAAYAAVLALTPAHAEVWHSLAICQYQQGRREQAVASLRRALALDPENPELLNNLGAILRDLRQVEEAIVCHHRALRCRPDFAEAHSNLGNALRDYGRLQEAALCYERALALKPDLAEAYVNLGNVLRSLGQAERAAVCYRRGLEFCPTLSDAYNNLGTLARDQGQFDEARTNYERALALAPRSAAAAYNLGNMLKEIGDVDGAERYLRAALAFDSQLAEAHLNLGNLLKDRGELAAALASFERALAARPRYAEAHSNLLFTLNYVDGVTAADLYARHRAFETVHAGPLCALRRPHGNAPVRERRLRIGYLSPDFRAHACAFFLEPLLANHDREAFEIYAYAEVARPDEVTAQLRARMDAWRSTVGSSDPEVAELIRADGIDVLVDLAGHTAHGRLLALAAKPAPVQVSYLGYPATTGLAAMDYRLTDARAEPPGPGDAFYTETLVRLPHSLWCYQPFADMPAVAPLPAARAGHLTFGSFNNYAKVGPRVVALWAEVLRAVPESRLLMITVPVGQAQDALRARFADLGVDPARLVLHGRLTREAYLATFAEVDVALDPFPCNGGTTTCDALWMGLPVVALIGDTFLSRASYSVLSAAGLPALATATPADYVARCASLASDRAALAALRAGLRDRLRASPLLDAPTFARDVERAYRRMWHAWCDRTGRVDSPAGPMAETMP